MATFHDTWGESCFAVSTFSTAAFRLASCFLRSAMWWSNFFMSFLKFSRNISRGFSTSLWSWSTSETDRVFYFRKLQETKAKSSSCLFIASVLEMHIRVYCMYSNTDSVCNICSHILQRAEHQHRAHSFRPAVHLDRIRMNPTGFECGPASFYCNISPWRRTWDELLLHLSDFSSAEPKLLQACWEKMTRHNIFNKT